MPRQDLEKQDPYRVRIPEDPADPHSPSVPLYGPFLQKWMELTECPSEGLLGVQKALSCLEIDREPEKKVLALICESLVLVLEANARLDAVQKERK